MLERRRIGKALAQLARTDAAAAAQVRDDRCLIACRNILIHGVAKVDRRIVWEVAAVNVSAMMARPHRPKRQPRVLR